jgi:raffinose/stachyose/melibiose transport system permease protein
MRRQQQLESAVPVAEPSDRRRLVAGRARAGQTPTVSKLLHFNLVGTVLGLLWLVIVLLPVYWMVITSVRHQAGYLTADPMVPSKPTIAQYHRVIDVGFLGYLRNSGILTAAVVLIVLVSSLMAGYAVVRGRGWIASGTFRLFLVGLAIPLQAVIIPIFYLVSKLQMYDTLWALIFPTAAFSLPISVLILVNFLRDVPTELFEAMRIDGASEWQMLWRLAVPLSRPALLTVGIFSALNAWNGFLFPLVLTQSSDTRVLPFALYDFQTQFGINVPAVLAAVILTTGPVFLLYLVGRRQLLGGLTAGFSR